MWLCVAEFYTPEGASAWAAEQSGEWLSRSGRHWAGVLTDTPPAMTVDTNGIGYTGNREDWIEFASEDEEFTFRHGSEVARLLFGTKRISSTVRLADYLTEDQLKMPIDQIPFQTLRPRPRQKRIERFGMLWKTWHVHPDDVTRNVFGELIPTDNRSWEDIALFVEEYSHYFTASGPVAQRNNVRWYNKDGTIYKEIQPEDLGEDYEGIGVARQGAKRRSNVVDSAQALAIKGIGIWAATTGQVQVTDGRDQLVEFLTAISIAAGKNVIDEYKLKDDSGMREQLAIADTEEFPWLAIQFNDVLGNVETVLYQLQSEFRVIEGELVDNAGKLLFEVE